MKKKLTDLEYEQLNKKLQAAIVTLTGAFIFIAFLLYYFLGRK
jgi:hypothetical protein